MVVARKPKSHASTSTPSSPELSDLISVLPSIFHEAQASQANHRKNISRLVKTQAVCAEVVLARSKGSPKLVGELAFTSAFIGCVERVLGVKKGVVVGDKVCKFVAGFVAAIAAQDEQEKEEEDEDEDTTASRFYTRLLQYLLQGFLAKDKNVRYRSCQLVSLMLRYTPNLDEDLFFSLRTALLERARDKEVAVRVQAVLGLVAFLDAETADEDEEDVVEVLLEIMSADPSADVRQTALFSLPCTKETIPFIILRTRDVDPTIRRNVYLRSLALAQIRDPRRLTITQREEVVRNGLGDRDPKVRKAAGSMVASWVDAAGEGGLLEFLSRFDVVTSEEAEKALISVFSSRPDLFEGVEFGNDFWTSLTPEKAILARVFVNRCREVKDDDLLEESLPVVTALAFYIQNEYNSLSSLLETTTQNEEEDQAQEQAVIEKTFIVQEMLKLAVDLDYADETGRRQMYSLARQMISQLSLPSSVLPYNLDVLRKLSDNERDLIRVVVEAVHEIRDSILEPDVNEDADGEQTDLEADTEEEDEEDDGEEGVELGGKASAKKARRPVKVVPELDEAARLKKAFVDLRGLEIMQALLERVNGTLAENSVLHGLVPDLIIPNVKGKQPELRERGIVCLGLICMIDKNSASNSFGGLFMQQVYAATGPLQAHVLQIIFDLLMIYDFVTLVPSSVEADSSLTLPNLISDFFALDGEEVLAIAVEGAAKLMLSGMLTDENVLSQLVRLYISPETSDNPALKQCLSYFLPVYCYSSPVNQRRMQKIFLTTLRALLDDAEDLDEDQEMVGANQIALLFLDWTDPEKAIYPEAHTADKTVQVDLALDLLKAMTTDEWDEERKVLTQLLTKLCIPDESNPIKIQELLLLTDAIQTRRPLPDSVSRNALIKFEASLNKRFVEELATLNEEQADAVDDLNRMFEDFCIEAGLPESKIPRQVAPAKVVKPRPTSKAKKASLAPEPEPSEADEEEIVTASASAPTAASNSSLAASNIVQSEDEADGSSEDDADSLMDDDEPDPPLRPFSKAKVIAEEEDEEEEDEEEDDLGGVDDSLLMEDDC